MRLSRPLITVTLGLSALLSAGAAAALPLEISGYAKTHTVSYDRAGESGGDVLWSSNNRVRLNARVNLTTWLGADAAYDVAARIQDKRLFAPDLSVSCRRRTVTANEGRSRAAPTTSAMTATAGVSLGPASRYEA